MSSFLSLPWKLTLVRPVYHLRMVNRLSETLSCFRLESLVPVAGESMTLLLDARLFRDQTLLNAVASASTGTGQKSPFLG